MTDLVDKIFDDAGTKPVQSSPVDHDDETSSCDNHSDGVTLSDCELKDSGIDTGGENMSSDIPDPQTAQCIREMVEFYMSDANILKDPFLLKHVRRNKEGYVSLKLLASFRKVRSLTRSWKAVAHSMQASTVLALNSDGSKVRRLAALPDYDETVSSRCVLVSGFSTDKPSVDTIGEMFGACGDIALVRIIRPRGSIPADVKKFLSRNPELQTRVCALVEFEEHAAVPKALNNDAFPNITVVSIATTNDTKSSPESPQKTNLVPKDSPKKKKKNRRGFEERTRTRRSSSGSTSSSSSYSSTPVNIFESDFPRRHSFNPSIYNDPNSSFASLNNRHQSLQGTMSPWRRRRQLLVKSDSNLTASVSSPSVLMTQNPVKTLRTPRGPDGTNGFVCSRPRLPSTAE